MDIEQVSTFNFDRGFASAAPSAPPLPPEVRTIDAPVQEFVREIDLGDGSGKQVFKAPTMEGLVDELAKAQEHASRKIRELAQAPVQTEPPPVFYEPEPMTAEQKFLLAQKMQTDPDEAFRQLFEHNTGMTLDEFQYHRDANRTNFIGGAQRAAVDDFLDLHEGVDYYPSEKNRSAMENFLQANQMAVTAPNLNYAFTRLNYSGLLEKDPNHDAGQSVISSMPSTISDRGAGQPSPNQAGSDVQRWLRTAPENEVRDYFNRLGGYGQR